MRKVTVHCDVCGRQKGETNHWWVARRVARRVAPGIPQLLIGSSTLGGHEPGDVDLCGSECVQRKVSEFLEGKA